MRMALALMMAAGGMLGTAAIAQTMAPPPPPVHGGGKMRVDANHDGTTTRAEMVARTEARFAAMDTDKDGKITAAERHAARQAMRAKRHRDGRRGGGGYGMRGKPDGDGLVTRADALQRAASRFDRLDTNRDGTLDASERAAARPMRGARKAGAMPSASVGMPVQTAGQTAGQTGAQ